MTSNAHSDQPRDSGKFSFKTSPEATAVHLGGAEAKAVDRPALDRLIPQYAAAAATGSASDRKSRTDTLDRLREAAENTSTDKEASQYLDGKWSDAIDDYSSAKHQKVALWDVPGLIRRRRGVRAAAIALAEASWANSRLGFEINHGHRGPQG
ncbi:MAG TPA: hypothetical protein VF885_11620 [Arthrobacter sp.]